MSGDRKTTQIDVGADGWTSIEIHQPSGWPGTDEPASYSEGE